MKKFIKNNIGEIASFFIAGFIFLIILVSVGLFDDKSIIISDLRTQVYPLLEYIKTNLFSGKFFIFDLVLGVGSGVFGILYYYLLSPFNILYLFINSPNIALASIIILKSAFAALFCYKFLKYQFRKEKKLIFVVFSLLYALSSYYVSYNMVVEFLDAYMWFPLVLLGIDKIIKEKKYLLYVVSLIMVILSNYYFGYMICIFSFIYFNYSNLIQKRKVDLVKSNVRFIGVSFLICLTLSFVFLPLLAEIGTYARNYGGGFGGRAFNVLFNLKDIFNHYIIGNFNDVNVINVSDFYLYTSIIVFPLIYFYFINNKIKMRERMGTGIIFLILLLSIGFNYVNYMWHGFGVPNGFNGRFTFMFILFIIMICTKSLYNIKKFKLRHYIISFSMIYFFVFLYSVITYPHFITIKLLGYFTLIYILIVGSSLLLKRFNISLKYYFISLISVIGICLIGYYLFNLDVKYLIYLVSIYIGIIVLYNINKSKNLELKHYLILLFSILILIGVYSIGSNINNLDKRTVIVLLLLLTYIVLLRYIPKYKKLYIVLAVVLVLEISINGYNYLERFPYRELDDPLYNDVISSIKKNEKSLFYRIEDNAFTSAINYSILYDYYGIDYFMSTINENYVEFFKNIGVKNYNTSDNSLIYDGAYHLVSSLLGVKYYVDFIGLESKFYEKIGSVDKYDIYKNDDSLSLGYMVDSDLKKIKYKDDGLEYINDIYKLMTDTDDDVLDKVNVSPVKKEKENYTFINSSDKDFYLLVDLRLYCEIPLVYVEGELLDNPNNTNMYYVENHFDKGEKIDIVIRTDDYVYDEISGVHVSYYDDDVYEDDIEILKKNPLNVTKINYDGFEGNVKVEEDGLLFLSTLYQDDLELYVDGKKYKKEKIFDTFVGAELKKGEHKIELKYKPKTIYISLIPSILGLVLLIIFFKKKKYFYK